MAFGLRDLDSGLFYTGHGWAHTPKFAQHFKDREEVEKLVYQQDIKMPNLYS